MTTTNTSLDRVEQSATSREQKDVLSLVNQTLQGKDDSTSKSIAIADGLREMAESKSSGQEVEGFLWDLWMMFVEIVSSIPADHLWQDILEAATKNLQNTGGQVWSKEENDPFLWSDLPYLAQYLLDVWSDPTEEGDGWDEEGLEAWKSLNSFAARLSTAEFHPWLHYSHWQIENALDGKGLESSALDCRIWVATEWILRCGELVFRLEGVSLRDSVSLEGLQQLTDTKEKLLEMEKNSENLGLARGTVSRMAQAAEKIGDIEANVRQG